MAFEGLRGSVARGASAGASVVNATANSASVRQRRREMDASQSQSRIENMFSLLEQDREQALEESGRMAEVLIQMKKDGKEGTPEYQQILNKGLPASLMRHGVKREQVRESAIAGGIDPQIAGQMGGGDFTARNLEIYLAELDATRDETGDPDTDLPADARLAEEIGYERGTDEYKAYLKKKDAQKDTLNDLMLPIYKKLRDNIELTEGEQKLLDTVNRLSLEERLLAGILGDDPFSVVPDDDGGGGGDEGDLVPPTREDVLKVLVVSLGHMEPGEERDAAAAEFMRAAKDKFNIDLTKEEVFTVLDLGPGTVIGSGPSVRGQIVRQ